MVRMIRTFEQFIAERRSASNTVIFHNPRDGKGFIPKWTGPAGIIQRTRGTTGESKYVHVSWDAINARSRNFAALRDVEDYGTVLSIGPLTNSFFLCAGYFGPYDLGSRIVFPDEDHRDAGQLIDDNDVTVLPILPSMIQNFVQSNSRPKRGTLRLISCGSAELSQDNFDAIVEWSGGARVITGYGSSETGVVAMTDGGPAGDGRVGKFVSDLRVSNGNIEVRGPSLATGYLKTPLPLLEGGWYRTKDRAEIIGDELYFRGRED